MIVSRRRFVLSAAGAISVTGLVGYGYFARECERCVVAFIPAEYGYIALGQRLIETQWKGQGDMAALKAELNSALPWYVRIAPRRAILVSIKQDFMMQKTLLFEGWVLPQTILLICTIAALEAARVS